MSEFLYNALVSYVNQAAGMDHAATTVQLLDTGLFPTTCNYRMTIDSEIMLVTANTGGLLTVVRAQEGTVASAHANQVPCFLTMTAGGLNAWGGGGGGSGVTPVGASAYVGSVVTAASGVWSVIYGLTAAELYGGATVDNSPNAGEGFVLGTAGVYLVISQVASTVSWVTGAQVGVGKNGSPVANMVSYNNSGAGGGVCTTVLALGASDVVSIMVYTPTAFAPDNSGLCRLTVVRVG